MRKLLDSPWQTLSIPSALTPIGQLHQSPPSPVPGDLGRFTSRPFLLLRLKVVSVPKIFFFEFLTKKRNSQRVWTRWICSEMRTRRIDDKENTSYLVLGMTIAEQMEKIDNLVFLRFAFVWCFLVLVTLIVAMFRMGAAGVYFATHRALEFALARGWLYKWTVDQLFSSHC